MILGEVTLTICLIYLQMQNQNTLYRGSNSYNLFDIFTNAISEHTIWGSNSYNLFDIFTNAISEHTI